MWSLIGLQVINSVWMVMKYYSSIKLKHEIWASYLDQPKSSGAAQARAMIQVKLTPAAAWAPVNLKLPMGLQTTMYLSTARTTRDQRAISPAGREKPKEVLYLYCKKVAKNKQMWWWWWSRSSTWWVRPQPGSPGWSWEVFEASCL